MRWLDRIAARLGYVPIEEAGCYVHERNEWRRRISAALNMTSYDYGIREATLDEAVIRISELKKNRM